MLQVLEALNVFDPADVDNAVRALGEEVCALIGHLYIFGEIEFVKYLKSFSVSLLSFALEIECLSKGLHISLMLPHSCELLVLKISEFVGFFLCFRFQSRDC